MRPQTVAILRRSEQAVLVLMATTAVAVLAVFSSSAVVHYMGRTKSDKVAAELAQAPFSQDTRGDTAYSVFDGRHRQIYTVLSKEEKPAQLTKDETNHIDPAYSPDGSNIAYAAFDGSHQQIYSIPSKGGPPIQLTTDPTDHFRPTYSSDGTSIIYRAADSSKSYQTYAIPLSNE